MHNWVQKKSWKGNPQKAQAENELGAKAVTFCADIVAVGSQVWYQN